MSDPTPNKSPGPFGTPRATFSVPRALFDGVPGRRATYIIAYAIFIALVYGPRVLAFAGLFPADSVAYALVGAGLAAYLVFAYQIIRAMRIMGFELWIILGVGLIALSAFPGPLLVAYIDRKIATAWDAADPSGGYRQPRPGP
jgi:hypothetical protein